MAGGQIGGTLGKKGASTQRWELGQECFLCSSSWSSSLSHPVMAEGEGRGGGDEITAVVEVDGQRRALTALALDLFAWLSLSSFSVSTVSTMAAVTRYITVTLDRLFLLGVLITVLCIMQRNNITLHSSVSHTSVSSRSGHLFPPFFGSRTTFLALVLVPLPHLTCPITRTERGSNTHV